MRWTSLGTVCGLVNGMVCFREIRDAPWTVRGHQKGNDSGVRECSNAEPHKNTVKNNLGGKRDRKGNSLVTSHPTL